MNKFKSKIQILIFLFLISGIAYSQNYIEAHKFKKNEMLYFVPKTEHLVYTHFGFKSVVADLLWLRGVSYFMYHMGKDNDYKYLYGMFNASIGLDPRFKQVYRDAMVLLLNDKEHYPESEKLIIAGMNHLSDDWEIFYMAGILYAYYIKDDMKSLKCLERCWGMIPRSPLYAHELESVNILIRSITEKKNDKAGLILYWINKFKEQQNKESRNYCVLQIKKYVSFFMEEKLNEILRLKTSEDEKNQLLKDAVSRFSFFYNENKLSDFIDVPLESLFSKLDAFGYQWVYSERETKLYSFGNAHEYLNRKINVFNIRLWEKIDKYLVVSVSNLLNYYPSERLQHIKCKPDFSQFPAFEEIYNEKNKWLKLEYPLFPVYDRSKGYFRVPEYEELVTIDKRYK